MTNSNVTIRIDSDLKAEGEKLFSDLGLSMTAAITAFISQSVREQAIPFKLTKNVTQSELPNEVTLRTFKEIDEMQKNPSQYKAYNNATEIFEDILN